MDSFLLTTNYRILFFIKRFPDVPEYANGKDPDEDKI